MENTLKKIKFNFITYCKLVFNFFISVLSLNKPSSRLIMIFLGVITLIFIPIQYIPLFSVFSKIGLYELLGFEFYSSGMTRALKSFFELDFSQSLEDNYLVFIFMLLIGILILLDIFRLCFRNNTNSLFKIDQKNQ